jgi:hypothetical protein
MKPKDPTKLTAVPNRISKTSADGIGMPKAWPAGQHVKSPDLVDYGVVRSPCMNTRVMR